MGRFASGSSGNWDGRPKDEARVADQIFAMTRGEVVYAS